MNNSNTTLRGQARTVVTNKVLKNTYILLSMTLLFSAFSAFVSYMMNISVVNPFITLGLYFITLYLTAKNKNNASGIFWVFCLTGVLGFTLGPILNIYMNNLSNGSEIVATALLLTGTIFLSLSAYVNYTKKDFSFMGGFVTSGIILAFVASIILLISSMMGYYFPLMMLGISSLFALLMCGLILFQTSAIIHGGEDNYVMATVTLYISIYNLFTSLLHILAAFMGGDD
ncbi:MAG: BAX inhibitor protein [Gammaproteobacteria bacterium]|nr:BAX inhibitor protein [Gammaproteobacteria bacterium]|tara:strand:+ start:4172 stop:4858 length:687 start_codon:yes stop_codon:yes gene_type:complete